MGAFLSTPPRSTILPPSFSFVTTSTWAPTHTTSRAPFASPPLFLPHATPSHNRCSAFRFGRLWEACESHTPAPAHTHTQKDKRRTAHTYTNEKKTLKQAVRDHQQDWEGRRHTGTRTRPWQRRVRLPRLLTATHVRHSSSSSRDVHKGQRERYARSTHSLHQAPCTDGGGAMSAPKACASLARRFSPHPPSLSASSCYFRPFFFLLALFFFFSARFSRLASFTAFRCSLRSSLVMFANTA